MSRLREPLAALARLADNQPERTAAYRAIPCPCETSSEQRVPLELTTSRHWRGPRDLRFGRPRHHWLTSSVRCWTESVKTFSVAMDAGGRYGTTGECNSD